MGWLDRFKRQEPKRVLVVDDAKIIRDAMAALLSDTYSVDVAESVPEAVGLLRRNKYDAILSDFQIGHDKYPAFEAQMKEAGIHTPVVLMSSNDRDEFMSSRGVGSNVVAFHDKMGSLDDLEEKMRQAVMRQQQDVAARRV